MILFLSSLSLVSQLLLLILHHQDICMLFCNLISFSLYLQVVVKILNLKIFICDYVNNVEQNRMASGKMKCNPMCIKTFINWKFSKCQILVNFPLVFVFFSSLKSVQLYYFFNSVFSLKFFFIWLELWSSKWGIHIKGSTQDNFGMCQNIL